MLKCNLTNFHEKIQIIDGKVTHSKGQNLEGNFEQILKDWLTTNQTRD